MAMGGSSGPGSGEERKAALTCTVCLEIFTNPKILPCQHTYCLKCIQDVASCHGGKSFPCPQCRLRVSVPPEGVAAFPTNIHILSGDLDRARNRSMCLAHPDKEIDVYCADCQQALCERCALFKHKQHDIQDLHEAASEARRQLQEDKDRLKETESHLAEAEAADNRELQSARDKRAAVEAAIRRRHASLVSVADKCRDDLLASLNRISADIEHRVTTDLHHNQMSLHRVRLLQQQLQEASWSGADHEALELAVEMREGQGGTQALSKLESPKRSALRRPVLSRKLTEDVISPMVWDVLGSVQEVKFGVTQPAVTVVEQFRCGTEDDTEVFSICPYDEGITVGLSFVRRGMNEDAPCELFDEKGKNLNTDTANTGKVSCKSRGNRKSSVTTKTAGMFRTFDKSQKPVIFLLDNNTASSEGHIMIYKVTSEDPCRSTKTILFTVNVGRHRTFDVDSRAEYFAVVEEMPEKEHIAESVQRKVHLYRREHRDALATYRPTLATCRPTDVCFWQQPDGREILVVADEGSDCLHVLGVEGGVLNFEGILAPACPLIVQPTALNTDSRGRLWVALRGGQILTLSFVP